MDTVGKCGGGCAARESTGENDGEHDDEDTTGKGRDAGAWGGTMLDPSKEASVGDEDEVIVAVKVDVHDDDFLDGRVGHVASPQFTAVFREDGDGVGAGGEDATWEGVATKGEGLEGWSGGGGGVVVVIVVVVVWMIGVITFVFIFGIVGVPLFPGNAGVLGKEFFATVIEGSDLSMAVEEKDVGLLAEFGCIVAVLAWDREGDGRGHVDGSASLDGSGRAKGAVEEIYGGRDP